jgi:anti-sigma regulatory factor (Ser/Thr protein kinase)
MNKKKKVFLRYRKWFQNRQQKIERQKRRKKKHGTNKPQEIGIKYTKDAIKVVFPEVIDLYNHKRCEETLDFFNREYNDIDNYKNGVIFNFSKVKFITLSGGIVIRCFFDFLLSKHTKVVCCGLKRDKITQILSHIGILKNENIAISYPDISRWTIRQWNKKEISKEEFSCELISAIIKTTTGWGEQSTIHKRLYEVVPEILFNCIQHAYSDISTFQYFYLFSGIVNNKYVFCILDRGIGFKATYEKWHDGYLDFNDIENDGDYIKYSIQLDHSSIKKSGRGNGLFTLKENIMGLGGMIFIHSYNGKVIVSKKNGEIESENRYPLIGSLVQFEIPMIKGN